MRFRMLICILLGNCAGACANIKGGVTGKVVDELNAPVSGARVVIYDQGKEKRVHDEETGIDGKFEYYETNFVVFNGYCGPTLQITVSKSGFAPVGKEFSHLCEFKEYNVVLRPE